MKTALILALSVLGSEAGRVLCSSLWDCYTTEFGMDDDEHAKLYAGSNTDRYEDLAKFAKELGWTVKFNNGELQVGNGFDMFVCHIGNPIEHWTIVK